MADAPPAREPHRCCCVFLADNGNEGPCGQMADPDSPFCRDCETHQTKEWQEWNAHGMTVAARIPVTRVTRQEKK